MGLEDSLKNFVKEQIFAVGFGAFHGATGGAYSNNVQEALDGALWFGAIFPTMYKMTGHHRTWKDAAWSGAKGTAAYFVAYNAAQLVFHQRI